MNLIHDFRTGTFLLVLMLLPAVAAAQPVDGGMMDGGMMGGGWFMLLCVLLGILLLVVLVLGILALLKYLLGK